MARYDYLCELCGEFEAEHSMSASQPADCSCGRTDCPILNGGEVKRLIKQAPPVKFVGTGWYKDLYSSKPPATGGGDAGSAGSGGSEKASGEKSASSSSASEGAANHKCGSSGCC